MKAQCLIASYAKDAVWLEVCLRSLKKFSVGFMPPVVAVSQIDYAQFREIADRVFPEAIISVFDGHGFMRAQAAMCSGDILCPDAEYVFLLGSDCMMVDTFSPEPFFRNGKPVMLYNTYQHLLKHAPGVKPWKIGTERVLGFTVPAEHMRRLPLVYPVELYPLVRAHIEELHKMPFIDYLYASDKSHGGNSESNILGSWAYKFRPDMYEWICLDDRYDSEMKNHPNPIHQHWSHGGIDRKCDRDMKYFGGSTLGKTPRNLFKEILG